MGVDAVLTIAVLLVTVALIAREVFSPDFLLLGALLVLAVAGVLTPAQVLAGFSNPAIATIAGLFLVAAGIRATGLIDRVTQAMFGEGASLRSVLARTTTLSAVGSAFMSNTAIVAIGIPTLDQWAREHEISPSKLLIPLSYASIIGGVSTLIGTSTNLVMDGLMRQNGIAGLGFFELAVVGVPVLAVGILYLTFLAPRILPARVSPETPTEDANEFVTDVEVDESSDLVGQTVEDAGLDEVQELYLVRIQRRASVVIPVEPGERLASGDRLTIAGDLEHIVELAHLEGIETVTTADPPVEEPTWEMYRAVIPRGSPLVGTRLKEAEFRARYNASVVAVQRRGEDVEERVGEARLRAGDTIILEASPDFDETHRTYNELFVMSPLRGRRPREPHKQGVAAGLLVGMIAAAATGLLALPIASPVAGLLMIITGCVSPDEARRSVNWSVLVAVGSAIGIASALDVSGAAAVLGQGIAMLADVVGTWGLLLGVFFGTVILTELIINQAAAALMFPVVIALANTQGLDPRPLVLTATVAASMSFSTPLNYQTNLMVYGPGKYRFTDFTKVGVPLQLLLSFVAVAIIQYVWPLAG
jgi:di/tricarboxylate transporter